LRIAPSASRPGHLEHALAQRGDEDGGGTSTRRRSLKPRTAKVS
jgi:hypothetical protein